MTQNRSTAVMQRRAEPHDSLDDFPTPPWATRALCEWLQHEVAVDDEDLRSLTCREPAANRGHMVRPLREFFGAVEGADVALVFGRERTGLDNQELQLCHAAVHIPSDPAFSSLNLAAAVQVLSYELRCALLGDAGAAESEAMRTAPPGEGAASHAELEGFFAQLGETLEQIDFHKGRAPESAMRKLRRLYLRANLDSADVRLLRGVLADAQRMARLAGQASAS